MLVNNAGAFKVEPINISSIVSFNPQPMSPALHDSSFVTGIELFVDGGVAPI